MEDIVEADGGERAHCAPDRFEHVGLYDLGPVAADPVRRPFQAGWVEIQQRDLGLPVREPAVVQKPAGANPYVQVARGDVPVVVVEEPTG
jgi:hypothetical protein